MLKAIEHGMVFDRRGDQVPALVAKPAGGARMARLLLSVPPLVKAIWLGLQPSTLADRSESREQGAGSAADVRECWKDCRRILPEMAAWPGGPPGREAWWRCNRSKFVRTDGTVADKGSIGKKKKRMPGFSRPWLRT